MLFSGTFKKCLFQKPRFSRNLIQTHKNWKTFLKNFTIFFCSAYLLRRQKSSDSHLLRRVIEQASSLSGLAIIGNEMPKAGNEYYKNSSNDFFSNCCLNSFLYALSCPLIDYYSYTYGRPDEFRQI